MPVVPAGIGVGGHDPGQGGAGGLAHQARPVVLRDDRLEHVEDRLVDGDVHELTGARFPALHQSEEDPERGVEAGQGVAEAQVGPHGSLPREAVQVAEPADALADRGIAGPLRIGAGLTVARYAGIDEAGIGLPERLRAEAPSLHRPGPEVLDHDVRALDETLDEGPAVLGPQAQGDRLLVAPEHPPEIRRPVAQHAPAADGVAAARRLDLDDLRPEVGKDAARERAGDELSELHHADAIEGPRCSHGSSPHMSPIFVARTPRRRGGAKISDFRASGTNGPKERGRAADDVAATTSKRLEGVRPANASGSAAVAGDR